MNTRIQGQAGRHSFPSLVILFGLALLSVSIFAAPPNPPVFTALDDQELDPPNPDGRYSLEDAIRGLPFTVNTPTPPQVAAEQIVTPSTLGNYINTPSIRLILEPGEYGNRTFNSQDQQIVLREGVYFGRVSIGGSARRIAIRNEVPRSGNMASISMPEGGWGGLPQDILIDGIRSAEGGNSINFVNGNRIAFLNSFIRTVDFPLSAFNGQYSDIIVANCNLEAYGSTQAGPRFQTINRFVFVDNRVYKTGSLNHSFRLHTDSGADIFYAYIGRNQFGITQGVSINPKGTGAPLDGIFHDIWFEDNNVHAQTTWSSAFIQVNEDSGSLTRLRVRRNNFYGPGPNLFGSPAGPVPNEPGWVVEGNTISGYQAPSPWDFQ